MNPILHILPAFSHLGLWGYWVVLLIAFFEAIVLVGVIIPGSTLIVLVGFLSAQGVLDIGDLIWFAAIGAILGDALSYYLGTKGTNFFHDENKFLKAAHLDRAELFFRKHGDKSIFFGRFIGFLRSLVPFVAGLSRMSLKRFLFWDVISAFLWAAAYLLLGYFFGNAFASIAKWTTRVGYTLGILAVAFFLLYGIRMFSIQYGYRVNLFLRSRIQRIKNKLATHTTTQRFTRQYPTVFAFLGKPVDKDSFGGLLLSLILMLIVYLFFTFLSTAVAITAYGSIRATDIRVANFFRHVRSPQLIKVFLWITALGTWQMVVWVGLLASIIFWLWRQRSYIFYLWIALGLDGLVSYLGKSLIHRPRPLGAVYIEPSYSFPSGHAMVSVVLYGFLAYVLIRYNKGWKRRVNIFFTSFIAVLAVGFSRLYLGVHYLSDVWGGYLLGLLILAGTISMYEWRRSKKEHGVRGEVAVTKDAKLLMGLLLFVGAVGYILFASQYHP
jgi:membrane protein DedA with SNARE-associated domain/membrane-associated phospholipid phosphatase